ncbi:hypothetical protein, variant [Aphanomyces invadans]|uniref:Uncharacterized protein n=1 Tax=Aphanomyces invadans TaxID=157072 RepID=A0A024TYA5_9STRA|nr:hypothetical protein H310_08738 [Aphanomyces invadans]XP_008872818.1 hypothetical protein, variant [Aphanomyces invadans]ETV98620.1 hypothetical protein H310_08738 [Aphanomyces invadans]ETV98621.1 hypothetical protein, variant [Aphanomyces invadans]|eukprot:XP_008872817.1 hypothetical protein H310_08738 [Aphanomyces invadans]
MAWGAKTGVTDLVQKLQAGNTKNMYVLRTRTVSTADAIALAAALATHPIMEEFYLSGHDLDAAGLAAFASVLATNTVLQKLAVGTSALGDAGVAVLANGLAQNPTSAIIDWDFELKGFGNAGAASIGAMLAANCSIRHVNVSRNTFDATGFDAIIAGLHASPTSTVQSLDVHDSDLVLGSSSVLPDYIRDSKCSLRSIVLTGNPLGKTATAFFSALGTNTSIESLHLSHCNLSDDALAALGHALATNQHLKHLDISHSSFSANSVDAFSHGLAPNRTLESLDLATTGLNDTLVDTLAAALPPQLTALNVSGNRLTAVAATLLLRSTSLTELRLFHNALGDGIAKVMPVLQANKTVQVLDVGANDLHGDLAVLLFNGLHAHSSLKTLEMGGNNLGDSGLAALEALHAANPSLDVAMDKAASSEQV